MNYRVLIVAWLVSLLLILDSQIVLAQGQIGDQIQQFELSDFRGAEFSLKQLADSEIVVVAFLGTECPLAQLYGARLQKLADELEANRVSFVGINSNSQDSVSDIGVYVRQHEIEFPMLKDVGNKIADRFAAIRTPEVYVLDQNRTIQYRGRIDDQYGVGYQKKKPTVNELRNAIDQLLSGDPVTTPVTEGVGCHIGRVKVPNEKGEVTYTKQISRILQERCVVCHRSGEIGPFSLTQYDEVAGWSEMIEEVVREQRMPPWNANPDHGEFANAAVLTDEEKQAIYRWVADGAPKGDDSDMPAEKEFVSGWQLPSEPDLVLNISPEPYEVKANGYLRYEYFTVDTGLNEDKWISAIQILPGNHRVVHHVLAFEVLPGQKFDSRDAVDGFLGGYVPGLFTHPFPEGMAKRLRKGAKIVFQVHYTPIGSPQTDQSKIGIVFADPDTITHEVITTSCFQPRIKIPPHDPAYKSEADSHWPLGGSSLLGMMPHMHLRGKAFRFEASYPNGAREVLLDVPRYDFNWQHSYRMAKPKSLHEGTRIHAFAEFDNSKDNVHNPDPKQTVRWGDQTDEEMMIGYFDIAVPIDDEVRSLSKKAVVSAEMLVQEMDRNRDGVVEKNEVPPRHKSKFSTFDLDADGSVSAREAAKVMNGIMAGGKQE